MKNYISKNLSLETFVDLFMQTPIALGFFKGEEMILEFANPLLLDILGKETDVIGKPIKEIFSEIEVQKFSDILLDVYTSGKPQNSNNIKILLKENEANFDFAFSPVFNESKTEMIGVHLIATKINDRISNKISQEFVNHELKTPLTSIKLYSQFLAKDLQKKNDLKNAELAKKIDHQINLLTNFINKMN